MLRTLLAVLLLAGCRRDPDAPTRPHPPTPTAPVQPDAPASEAAARILGHAATELRVTSTQRQRTHGRLVLDEQWPALPELDPAAAAAIDEAMSSAIDAWAATIPHDGKGSARCKVGVATTELIAVSCDLFDQTERSHPAATTVVRTFAIDGSTARVLALGDVLHAGTDVARLAERTTRLYGHADGFEILPWRAGVCAIEEGAFWIDEYGLYLSGQPEKVCWLLLTPWSHVQPLLVANGPVQTTAALVTTFAPAPEPAHLGALFRRALPPELAVVERAHVRKAGRVELEIRWFELTGTAAATALDAAVRDAGRIAEWKALGKGEAGNVLVECSPGAATTELVSFGCEVLDARTSIRAFDAGEGGAPAFPTPATRTFAIDGAALHPIALADLLAPGADLRGLARAIASSRAHATDNELAGWRDGSCTLPDDPRFVLGFDALTLFADGECASLNIPYWDLEQLVVSRGALHRWIGLCN